MKIDKRFLGLCEIAGNDARPILSGIKFEKNRAVATDGFRLMIIQLEQDISKDDTPIITGQEESDPGECVLPAKGVADILKQIRSNKNIEVLNTAWTVPTQDPWVRFVTTNIDTNTYKELKKIEGDYPKYESVLKIEEKHSIAEVEISAKMLADTLKSMIRAGIGWNDGVQIKIFGANEAVIITGKDHKQREIKAVVMPRRMINPTHEAYIDEDGNEVLCYKCRKGFKEGKHFCNED